MNGNPFYVAPADYSQGLSGLGAIAGQYRQQKRMDEIKSALSDAYRSGDPNKIAELTIQYPEARDTLQALYGFRNDETKRNALDTYKTVLTNKQNPAAALDAINKRIAFVESQGGDPSSVTIRARDQLQALVESGQDTGPFFRAAELDYAGIASPQEWSAYAATSGANAGRIGQYNPGDYTPDSWAQFLSSRDPSVLQRYENQQIVDMGGVKYLVDRSTGQRTPLSTVEEVSGSVEQIKGAGERGKQNVRAETEPKIQADIARARELATAEAQKQIGQKGQLGKLEDATEIYNRLRDSDLEIIYGRGEQWYPDFLRSQRGIDLIADRDQLVNMLKLGAAGELKGQGTITDAERKMLADAATQLGNPNISPPKARESLDDAMRVLTRNTGGQFQGGSGQGAMTPGINQGGETAAQRLARLRGGN